MLVTHELDWYTAPDDATHCDIGGNYPVWLKGVTNTGHQYLNTSNEWDDVFGETVFESLVSRPARPQLNRDDAIKLLAALEHEAFVSSELNELKAYGWGKSTNKTTTYFYKQGVQTIIRRDIVTAYPEPKQNKYNRELKGVTVDVYDVLKAFNVTCPATQHALKKMLCAGLRGHKDIQTDLDEAISSLQRAKELV